MIKFSVGRLDKETIELSGSEPPEFLGLSPEDPYEVVSDIQYDIEVKKVSGGALVSGTASVIVATDCGRCLERTECEIATEQFEIFLDLDSCGEEVDLSEDVRSELVLELPMFVLCSDDCAGLCPECGCNLNIKTCQCNVQKSGSLAWSELDDLKL